VPGDEEIDSDVDPVSELTEVIMVSPGEVRLDVDAGLAPVGDEPGDGEIEVIKTVYLGHDSGAGCDGLELVTGLEGAAVTYCIKVTNIGEAHLANVFITDTDVDPNLNEFIALMAPGATTNFIIETSIESNLINTAFAVGEPADPDGNVFPNVDPVEDDDPAEVQEIGINLEKTVSLDGNCPGVENVTGFPGTTVTYCFEITNTSDVDLFNVQLVDTDISPAVNQLAAAVLNSGQSITLQVDRSIPVNPLLNTATTTAIDSFQNQVTDSDTASVDPLDAETGTITGYAFYDLNNNGIADDNLTTPLVGFNNVTVQLIRGGTVIDSIDTVLNTGTGEYGYYEFTGLALDETYRTRVVNSDLRGELGNVTGAPASSFVNTTAVTSPNIRLTSANPTGRFDFGIRGAPTAVNLVSFTANRVEATVIITWQTGSETDNLGFRIYRADSENGERVLVSDIILAAGSSGGSSYEFIDQTATDGDWYYWLEDIDKSGELTQHGPVSVSGQNSLEKEIVGSIELTREGVYRISSDVLSSAGLDDPTAVTVLIDEVEVPCKVVGGGIIFYAPAGSTIAEFMSNPDAMHMDELDTVPEE